MSLVILSQDNDKIKNARELAAAERVREEQHEHERRREEEERERRVQERGREAQRRERMRVQYDGYVGALSEEGVRAYLRGDDVSLSLYHCICCTKSINAIYS